MRVDYHRIIMVFGNFYSVERCFYYELFGMDEQGNPDEVVA